MRAAIDGNQAEARKLYQAMTMDAINAKTPILGWTALMFAAKHNRFDIARDSYVRDYLDVEATNSDDKTATEIALRNGHGKLAELLIQMRLIDLAHPAE